MYVATRPRGGPRHNAPRARQRPPLHAGWARAADRTLTRGQAGTVPVVLSGGAVAGIWHHKRTGRRLRITVELLRDLTSSQLSELVAEVERTGDIVAPATELVYGEVGSARHL